MSDLDQICEWCAGAGCDECMNEGDNNNNADAPVCEWCEGAGCSDCLKPTNTADAPVCEWCEGAGCSDCSKPTNTTAQICEWCEGAGCNECQTEQKKIEACEWCNSTELNLACEVCRIKNEQKNASDITYNNNMFDYDCDMGYNEEFADTDESIALDTEIENILVLAEYEDMRIAYRSYVTLIERIHSHSSDFSSVFAELQAPQRTQLSRAIAKLLFFHIELEHDIDELPQYFDLYMQCYEFTQNSNELEQDIKSMLYLLASTNKEYCQKGQGFLSKLFAKYSQKFPHLRSSAITSALKQYQLQILYVLYTKKSFQYSFQISNTNNSQLQQPISPLDLSDYVENVSKSDEILEELLIQLQYYRMQCLILPLEATYDQNNTGCGNNINCDDNDDDDDDDDDDALLDALHYSFCITPSSPSLFFVSPSSLPLSSQCNDSNISDSNTKSTLVLPLSSYFPDILNNTIWLLSCLSEILLLECFVLIHCTSKTRQKYDDISLYLSLLAQLQENLQSQLSLPIYYTILAMYTEESSIKYDISNVYYLLSSFALISLPVSDLQLIDIYTDDTLFPCKYVNYYNIYQNNISLVDITNSFLNIIIFRIGLFSLITNATTSNIFNDTRWHNLLLTSAYNKFSNDDEINTYTDQLKNVLYSDYLELLQQYIYNENDLTKIKFLQNQNNDNNNIENDNISHLIERLHINKNTQLIFPQHISHQSFKLPIDNITSLTTTKIQSYFEDSLNIISPSGIITKNHLSHLLNKNIFSIYDQFPSIQRYLSHDYSNLDNGIKIIFNLQQSFHNVNPQELSKNILLFIEYSLQYFQPHVLLRFIPLLYNASILYTIYYGALGLKCIDVIEQICPLITIPQIYITPSVTNNETTIFTIKTVEEITPSVNMNLDITNISSYRLDFQAYFKIISHSICNSSLNAQIIKIPFQVQNCSKFHNLHYKLFLIPHFIDPMSNLYRACKAYYLTRFNESLLFSYSTMLTSGYLQNVMPFHVTVPLFLSDYISILNQVRIRHTGSSYVTTLEDIVDDYSILAHQERKLNTNNQLNDLQISNYQAHSIYPNLFEFSKHKHLLLTQLPERQFGYIYEPDIASSSNDIVDLITTSKAFSPLISFSNVDSSPLQYSQWNILQETLRSIALKQ